MLMKHIYSIHWKQWFTVTFRIACDQNKTKQNKFIQCNVFAFFNNLKPTKETYVTIYYSLVLNKDIFESWMKKTSMLHSIQSRYYCWCFCRTGFFFSWLIIAGTFVVWSLTTKQIYYHILHTLKLTSLLYTRQLT